MKVRTKLETDFNYTNKFTRKRLRFSPKLDEVVVTFQPQPDLKSARHAIGSVPLPRSRPMIPEIGFAVFDLPRGHKFETNKSELEARPDVANVIPVFIGEEGLRRYFVPDEFTVQFQSGITNAQAERIVKRKACQVVLRQRTPGYYTLAVPGKRGLFEMLREFSALEEVKFAEPSEVGFDYLDDHIPMDGQFPNQWGLKNTGQAITGEKGTVAGTPGADIRAVKAWDITLGSPNVIVAILDSGIDLSQSDLAANILPRGNEDWDFIDSNDSSPDDTFFHGTALAGIVAAAENGSNLVGVAPQCRIMPLRIFKGGIAVRLSHAADAINFVANHAVANPNLRYIINISWGGPAHVSAIHNAIINATNENVLVVAAAGNNHKNKDGRRFFKQYPAFFSEVISVAATDQNDRKADFSNFGASVDVSAPGKNIFTTFLGGGNAVVDGTSAAAPFVAGVAALVWSLDQGLTNQEVRDIVEKTCDSIDDQNPGFEGLLGKGRVNAFKALSATPFSFLVFPQTLELVPGVSEPVNLNIRRSPAFASNQTHFSVPTPPLGLSVPAIDTVDSTDSLLFTVGPNAPFGTRDVVIEGSTQILSGITVTNSVTLQLSIKEFFLELSAPDAVIKGDDPQHNSATITITIKRGVGFNGSVNLSLQGVPAGGPQGGTISATVNPSSTAGNTSTLHVSAGRFASENNFVITIRGQSGNFVDTVQLGVEVLGSDVASPIEPVQP